MVHLVHLFFHEVDQFALSLTLSPAPGERVALEDVLHQGFNGFRLFRAHIRAFHKRSQGQVNFYANLLSSVWFIRIKCVVAVQSGQRLLQFRASCH